MSSNSVPNDSWKPVTSADRDRVLAALHAMLSSHHFRNSKRYPALLEYVVTKTIEGDTAQIKERTLGVEVFDRRPDYDTNEDPVVRFSAGAVRKKIAQYYQEAGNDASGVHINLPLGSYVPEFRLSQAEHPTTANEPKTPEIPAEPPAASQPIAETKVLALGRFSKVSPFHRIDALAVLLLLLTVGGLLAWQKFRVSEVDRVWAPLLKSPQNVLVILGDSHPELGVELPQTTIHEHLMGPYQHVSLSSATSMARLCGLLTLHGKGYDIREDPVPTLTDLRTRPIILIGAMNNFWSLRLNEHLPLRFRNGPIAEIFDPANPSAHQWQLDFAQPLSSVATDYAVVARYQDVSTDGPVILVAGLGPYGTETAAEFVTSPRFLSDLTASLPAGWEKKNFEVVLKTNVIKGNNGPPFIVASKAW